MSFVHLHNHTQYSLLDGACRIDKMIALAQEYNMPAVAMTDHGNMFGAFEFYQIAKRKGIKPIIGTEAYVVNSPLAEHDKTEKRYHLVLLAKNFQGYQNLIKISSLGFTDGFYYRPRINKEILEQYSEGLIVLSACIQGEIPRLLINGLEEEAREALRFYKNLFGDDFYIELQDHNLDDEKQVMPKLIALAQETNTPMVVTNDCHYLHQEDAEAHEVLLCIQTGHKLTDEKRMQFHSNQLYFKSPEEMQQLFPQVPEAYENTLKIADKIDLQLEYNEFLFPKTDIPEQFADSNEFMRHLCYEGAKERYSEMTDEIRERIDFELSVIGRMGYNDYFLIVKDFIDEARSRNIPVGPGRGSAAGSIVAYLLGITQLDPLKYGLLFERFLDLKRVGMPDIDIDFCAEGRAEVIDYVVEKYGRTSVAQIVTFGTLGAKSTIKDVARVLDIPAAEANRITKLMPSGPKTTLKSSLRDSVEFKELMESNETYEKILRYSQALEGLVRQTGIHAAGVVIGPGDLSNYVPLAISTQKGSDKSVLVQFEGKWLDDLRMLKMDFLGLKTLTLIKRAVRLVKQSQGIQVDMDHVDLTDEKTFELLSQGKTDGVFQFESGGMKKYLRELKPNVFEDIIAMVALYRPGPMQFIDTFIKRKHGIEKIEYDHPLTQNALEETYGVTVYQEQVMRISKEMGGFESAEAGALRKAISKKKADLMATMYENFKKGSMNNGVDVKTIDKIWSNWQDFANYAFNKSHAACYAYIAFQTAYLKAHFPVEFMAALLSLEENPDKIPAFLDECKNMKIEVIPPDINLSGKYFTVQGNRILFGLQAIKNVGNAAIDNILEERDKDGTFNDLFHFCERVSAFQVNRSTLESLIKAGAMDSLGQRDCLFASIDTALNHGASRQRDQASGQLSLFGEATSAEFERPKLPKKYPQWSDQEKLRYEKEVLGFFISGHPILQHSVLVEHCCDFNSEKLQHIKDVPPRENQYSIAGFVSQVAFKRTNRNNDMFALLQCEDMQGSFEVIFWPKAFEENKAQIQKMSEENGVYIFQGSLNCRNENQVSFVAEKAIPASQAHRIFNHTVKICLNEEDLQQLEPEKLTQILQAFPGNFVVELEIDDHDLGVIHASTAYKVDPSSDFLADIETVCGPQKCFVLK